MVIGYARGISEWALEITNTGGLYDVDTTEGQSGSIVILEDDYNCLVGIHKGYDPKMNKNSCCLVSPQMIE